MWGRGLWIASSILFFLIQARCEIIDIDVPLVPFIIDTEDLTRELFFECFLSTFRLEPLGAAAGGFRIRTKIFPAIAARFYG